MKDPHRSDLFIFDTTTLQNDILLHDGPSNLRYQEYAVFAKDAEYASTTQSGETDDRPFLRHTGQCIISEDDQGDALFHQAVGLDYGIDADGVWGPGARLSRQLLQGRMRQIICTRRPDSRTTDHLDLDGLNLTKDDYAAMMDLHPATLQYVRRRAVESMFWDRHHEKLSIILSFPAEPRAPFDFLSMTYSVAERNTTLLIRESFDPQRHSVEDIDGYDQRMQACRAHWAHPLVVPVVLLQVQFSRTERAVADNHSEVIEVERDVSNMAGFDAFDDPERRRRASSSAMAPVSAGLGPRQDSGHSRRSSAGQTGLDASQQVFKKSTELMKNAHDVLKNSIRLLDTLNWMERAIQILLDAGDQLDDVRQGNDSPMPSSATFPIPLSAKGRVGTGLLKARIVDDPLAGHWHEIKQYLEGLQQLCLSLKTDRKILEMRCNALVDIIYSKMAQEDNNLNARMAVASSRDSSSMKALAVITAVFLPGEFMSSLFGMGIFNWQGNDGTSDGDEAVVGYDFWVYWAITLPVTIIILIAWRVWWVAQDRVFRSRLSKNLSEEKYYTDDRKPRKLETSFLYDFLYLSVRKGEVAASSRFPGAGCGNFLSKEFGRIKWFERGSKQGNGVPSPPPALRLRQTAFEHIHSNKQGMV